MGCRETYGPIPFTDGMEPVRWGTAKHDEERRDNLIEPPPGIGRSRPRPGLRGRRSSIARTPGAAQRRAEPTPTPSAEPHEGGGLLSGLSRPREREHPPADGSKDDEGGPGPTEWPSIGGSPRVDVPGGRA